MGGEPGLMAIGIDHADLIALRHGGDQHRLAEQPRGAAHGAGVAHRGAGEPLQLPGVGGEKIGPWDQVGDDGLGHLAEHIEALARVPHDRIDDDPGLRRVGALPRAGADGVDGLGRGPHLGGGGEIAGDHQVHEAEQAIGLHPVQHPLERLHRHRRPAGRTPAGMTAIEDRGDQHRIDLQLRQRHGLHKPPDAAGGDVAGHDQGERHAVSGVRLEGGYGFASVGEERQPWMRVARWIARRAGAITGDLMGGATIVRCWWSLKPLVRLELWRLTQSRTTLFASPHCGGPKRARP